MFQKVERKEEIEVRKEGTKEIIFLYIGYTQKNGAVLIVNTIKTAPLFCVCPVYI
jgi:hypothetical protein